MTGVPLFRCDGDFYVGLDVAPGEIMVNAVTLLGYLPWWAPVSAFPVVLDPVNSDARAMLKIARAAK